MKHLGDITKIRGNEVPLVDIITGGSPCQDLSIAGKRAGLDGERSGLFMEQIRIIKEMRDESRRQLSIRGADYDRRDIRPRYMVWENVPGAFSSNKGEDFRAVLEETARIIDQAAVIPGLENNHKWSTSGCILGDGWSIAWRLHDAQFWGVPQRRKRIALVADFGGLSAPEILFERKGLSGDLEPSEPQGEETPGAIRESTNSTSYTLKIRGGREIDSAGKRAGKGALIQTELSGTLGVSQDQTMFIFEKIPYRKKAHPQNETLPQLWEQAKVNDTLNAFDNSEMRTPTVICENRSMVFENHSQDSRFTGPLDIAPTITSRGGTGGNNQPLVVKEDEPYVTSKTQFQTQFTNNGKAPSLVSSDYKDPMIICQKPQTYQDKVGALCARDWRGVGNQYIDDNKCVIEGSIVRRLTPKEYERLQGFPDDWTNIGEWTDSKGKKHKDSDGPRYKALGNSIALPFWSWMSERMIQQLNVENPTMASLFDGIGGFPLVYSRCGCEPIWASEIEEFPIAVTKIHFPDK